MVDNVAVTPGAGATIAADDIGGVLVQRVKATWGVDGTATDVSLTDPLPVEAATLPLPTGAATEAKQDSMISAINAPASELPPPALSTTKRLTRAVVSSTTATTTSLVTATASQTTRLHRAIISCAGACLVELLDGTTNRRTIRFAGAGIVILDFSEEPWVITTANAALQFKTSTAVQVDVDIEYVKSA